MEIRIDINCDNAAFEHAPEHETARILRWLAKEIQGHGIKLLAGGHKVRDINGNTVGKAWIVEESEPTTLREFFAQARRPPVHSNRRNNNMDTANYYAKSTTFGLEWRHNHTTKEKAFERAQWFVNEWAKNGVEALARVFYREVRLWQTSRQQSIRAAHKS